MSHRNVEAVIGRLVTDEALRWEFRRRPASVLLRLADEGTGLTNYEVDAILGLDMAALERFVATLDPRLQKASLRDLEDPTAA
ncbi:MAG TPA: Os1348 family NHLP clan protein [Vicinamibacteria bacterium]|nr:Os1348 family NHLP clan protein [Vicinamibacteria bacterium]